MKIRTIVFTCTFILLSLNTYSQESDSTNNFDADVSVDFVSRYVWRGVNLSESPSIQPTLAFSFKGLSLGSWASYSFARETFQEVDLFLTYETNYLTFTVNDYYNPLDTLGFTGDYFLLSKKNTRHTLEGLLSLTGPESFPLTFTGGVMLYGNDRDENGNNLYSTYLELSYAFKINAIEVTPFIGITPAKGFYGNEFGVVNMGVAAVKNLEISGKFQVPLKASFIVNPQQERVYFVVGFTF